MVDATSKSFFYRFLLRMNQQESNQIKTIIINIEEKRWYIPYFSDLENHEVFGSIFKSISDEEKIEIQHIINDRITEKTEEISKTKWGQLFKRFFEAYNELFWKFRTLNEKGNIDQNFQEIGKKVEQEIFKLEWILTEKMLKQEKWLDKVIDSFYKIVYTFFPKYNQID
jgi:SHS2 domain-containing protein